MRSRTVLSVLGYLVMASGLAMGIPCIVSLTTGEKDTLPFLVSSLLSTGIGWLATRLRPRESYELQARDGFAIVTFGWLLIPLFGSLPFYFSGVLPSLHDAFFESVSGFTTTGASVIRNVEVLPHGILLWRSLTHWLGGMGIIVLYVAVLPMMSTGAMQLYRAEVVGPVRDKLAPRVAGTARLLWGIYASLTGIEILLLIGAGMPVFDSVCHAFGTIATGGFSVKNASLAYYNSPVIEAIVTLFMLLSAVSFGLHYAALRQGVGAYWRSDEFRFFISMYLISVTAITGVLSFFDPAHGILNAFRIATFNVASIMTCTGFSTADFALWAPVAQVILLFLMFPGGCAGSTAGGMKNLRVLVLLRHVAATLRRLDNPNLVVPVRIDGSSIGGSTLRSVGGFVLVYLTTFLVASIVLTETGLDTVTAASAAATCLAGIGPGLGSVGPMNNYADLLPAAKGILAVCMVLGRLEIYAVIVVLFSGFFRR